MDVGDNVRLTRATMSPQQVACWDLICDVCYGEHHAPDHVYAFGRGIKCAMPSNRLATFDFNELTRLVVMAHDRCIRVELVSSSPGRIGVVLHQRHGRTGSTYERHPTIEEAIAMVRGGRAAERAAASIAAASEAAEGKNSG